MVKRARLIPEWYYTNENPTNQWSHIRTLGLHHYSHMVKRARLIPEWYYTIGAHRLHCRLLHSSGALDLWSLIFNCCEFCVLQKTIILYLEWRNLRRNELIENLNSNVRNEGNFLKGEFGRFRVFSSFKNCWNFSRFGSIKIEVGWTLPFFEH